MMYGSYFVPFVVVKMSRLPRSRTLSFFRGFGVGKEKSLTLASLTSPRSAAFLEDCENDRNKYHALILCPSTLIQVQVLILYQQKSGLADDGML
jgi:hypothetical protein